MADNKKLEDKLDSVRNSLDNNRKAIRDAEATDKEIGRQMISSTGETLKELREQKKANREAIANLNRDQTNIIKSLEGTQKYNLGVVAEKIATSNSLLKEELAVNELKDKLIDLNKESTEETKALSKLFEQAVITLKDPESSEESLNLAREQIEAIQDSAATEEETREADKRAKAERNIFNRMATKLDNVADGISNMETKAASGLGLIGALGGIALALFDPQTLFDIMARAIEFVSAVIKTVEDIFSGEQSLFGGISTLFENFGTEMTIIGGFLALKFGLISTSFRAISSTLRAIPKIFSGISKFLGAIPGTASKLLGVVGKLALPITIITGIIGGIVNSFDKFKEGDILGGLYAFIEGAFDSIISAPINLLKDLTSWVLKKFGFDESAEALDGFDFSFERLVTFISDTFGAIFDWVMGLIPSPDDAIKTVKKGIGGVVDFFTGGGDDEEERKSQDTFDTTEAEKRRIAQMNSRKRRAGEIGGLELDRISTPMERAVVPELQTEDRDLGAPQRDDSRSLAAARNRYRLFRNEEGFEGEAEAARLKIIELEKQEAVSPIRDTVVENQMLREQEQARATAAVVDNSSRQNNNTNVQTSNTNVYNTAFVDDVNSDLAFSP